jgi:hypothetical protein
MNVFVDYGRMDFVEGADVTVGSPIDFIDNDGDGRYEFVIARNLVYSKVTNVNAADENKVVAVRGNTAGFDTARSLNNAKMADIYNGADLKVDSRALVYKIGDKHGVEIVEPMKGTLTQSRDNGGIAFIGGKEYKESALATRASVMSAILDSANFNVEKEYYADANAKLLEGPGAAPDNSKWALLLDSYYSSGDLVGGAVKQVSLLLEDGTKGTYNLSAILDTGDKAYGMTRATSTGVASAERSQIKLTNANDGNAENPATVYARTVATNAFDAGELFGGAGYIFKAVVSDDGKSVELHNPSADPDADKTASPAAAYGADGGVDGLTYTKGNSFFGDYGGDLALPLTSESRIMDSTVIFGLVPYADGSVNSAGAFKGRTIDSFDSTGLTSGTGGGYVAAYHEARQDAGYVVYNKPLQAVAIVADNVPTKTTVKGTFAYIIKVDVVEKNEAGNFYAVLTMWDGEKIDTFTGADGIRANTDGWDNDEINDVKDGLNGSNIGIKAGDAIEYYLNSEGKISSMVKYMQRGGAADTAFEADTTTASGTLSAASNTPAGAGAGFAYVGYYTVPNSSYTRLYAIDDVSRVRNVEMSTDADFYVINSDTDIQEVPGMPTANHDNGVKVIMLTEQKSSGALGEVAHTIYIFPNVQKDIADANAVSPSPPPTDPDFALYATEDQGFWGENIGSNTYTVLDYAYDYAAATPSRANAGWAGMALSGTAAIPNMASDGTPATMIDDGTTIGVLMTKNGGTPYWTTITVGTADAKGVYALSQSGAVAWTTSDGTWASGVYSGNRTELASDVVSISKLTGVAASMTVTGNVAPSASSLVTANTSATVTLAASYASSVSGTINITLSHPDTEVTKIISIKVTSLAADAVVAAQAQYATAGIEATGTGDYVGTTSGSWGGNTNAVAGDELAPKVALSNVTVSAAGTALSAGPPAHASVSTAGVIELLAGIANGETIILTFTSTLDGVTETGNFTITVTV